MRTIYDIFWSKDYIKSEKWELTKSWLSVIPGYYDFPEICCTNIFHIAAKSGNIDLFNKVLAVEQKADQGFDINSRDANGWTALHIGSLQDSVPIVEALINIGAGEQVVNKNGETPFGVAKENFSVKVCAFFLETGHHLSEPNSVVVIDSDRETFHRDLIAHFNEKSLCNPEKQEYKDILTEITELVHKAEDNYERVFPKYKNYTDTRAQAVTSAINESVGLDHKYLVPLRPILPESDWDDSNSDDYCESNSREFNSDSGYSSENSLGALSGDIDDIV